jgi:hypothetical protein
MPRSGIRERSRGSSLLLPYVRTAGPWWITWCGEAKLATGNWRYVVLGTARTTSPKRSAALPWAAGGCQHAGFGEPRRVALPCDATGGFRSGRWVVVEPPSWPCRPSRGTEAPAPHLRFARMASLGQSRQGAGSSRVIGLSPGNYAWVTPAHRMPDAGRACGSKPLHAGIWRGRECRVDSGNRGGFATANPYIDKGANIRPSSSQNPEPTCDTISLPSSEIGVHYARPL